MDLDPDTTYLRDNDGALRPVVSTTVWCPAGEPAENRLNAALARRIAAYCAAGHAAWKAGELARMIRANRRARVLRRVLLSRLPAACDPYRKGVAA